MNELVEKLSHICTAQEEIISLQKEIIDESLYLLLQYISVTAEELKPIVQKINEAATIKMEIE